MMNIFQKFTLRTLKENKTRTLATIVGIILSVAMLTAVTTSVSSLYRYMVDSTIQESGNWHGVIYNMKEADTDALSRKKEVAASCRIQNVGYARLGGENRGNKPYLYVGGVDSQFLKQMSIHLIEGSMPENSNEIILPEQVTDERDREYKLGEKITLKLGERQKDGDTLWQNDGFVEGVSEDEQEQLVNVETKTYTVVGFFQRQYALEGYLAPGSTALTGVDETIANGFDCYIQMRKSGKVYDFLESYYKDYVTATNESLLRYMGTSEQEHFNAVVYGLVAILIGIIMLGSISLIYNAFSISVSERTKAFGLLSSIGATKKQMRKSVGYEAGFLCLIGVPLGILAGILGMTITFRVLSRIVDNYLIYDDTYGVTLGMHPSWQALLIALVIGVITVYISAWIPTRRALRVNTIDAIRQTQDVKVQPGKLKVSPFTSRFFGFEGMLGNKNYKRNKKKYRATVVSLFISVVLFISASSFQSYLTKGVEAVIGNMQYDVGYTSSSMSDEEVQEINEYMKTVDGVTKESYVKKIHTQFAIAEDRLNPELLDFFEENEHNLEYTENGKYTIWDGVIAFVAEDEYEAYLKQNGFDVKKYMDVKHPVALVKDKLMNEVIDGSDKRYYTGNAFKEVRGEIMSQSVKQEIDGLDYSGSDVKETGERVYIYTDAESASGEPVEYMESEVVTYDTLQMGERTDKGLFCMDLVSNYGNSIVLLYPYRAYSSVINKIAESNMETFVMCQAANHKQVHKDMNAYITKQFPDGSGDVYDYAQDAESQRALITIINIFAYGFIVLISLIAMANVFNTISTNIRLRRREFAMLKSVGMTSRGFNKMMNYECLLYGVKGLVYGLPVSFLVTWLIYRSISEGIMQSFYVPWSSVVIAVFSVFAVVFATMLYAMQKIKKDNPMDALKNENM